MPAAGTDRTADIEDIRRLGGLVGVTTASDALEIVMRYYPAGRISPKTRFGLEEIFGSEAH